jgi:hypothetical protein
MWSSLRFSSDLEFMAVPSVCPCNGIPVDIIQKQVMEEPDVGRVVNVKAFICFQVGEKCFPLATKPFRNIIPDSLNPAVMNTPDVRKLLVLQPVGAERANRPSPDIRTSSTALVRLHPFSHPHILCPMIPPYSAWCSMDCYGVEKELEYSFGPVVVMGLDPHH